MPFFCKPVNSFWRTCRRILGLKRNKRPTQNTSQAVVTIEDLGPMTLEKTPETCPVILEKTPGPSPKTTETRDESFMKMTETMFKSNLTNLELTEPFLKILETTSEFDPTSTDDVDKPTPEMLAAGYDVSDRLNKYEKEINRFKAENIELTNELNMTNKKNRMLGTLSGK